MVRWLRILFGTLPCFQGLSVDSNAPGMCPRSASVSSDKIPAAGCAAAGIGRGRASEPDYEAGVGDDG